MILAAWRKLLRFARPPPQWQPVALQAPQSVVRVELRCGAQTYDVTSANVVASLRPLALACAVNAAAIAALRGGALARLDIRARDSTLGTIELRFAEQWTIAGTHLAIFEIERATHRCLPWIERRWSDWYHAHTARRGSQAPHVAMSAEAIAQLGVFYICPRPVVLVSVETASHGNLFPMDLIGPVAPGLFTLALRSSSASVPAMLQSRRVALADVPASDVARAYALGAHHKNPALDWNALPFALRRSRDFGLRVPENALRVRELEIIADRIQGSHTMFACHVTATEQLRDALQMFHVNGAHFRHAARHGRPFVPAPTEPR